MKITLKDFGPISHFEFDLEKDLHVIFGKNNIGKSYAITAVYLILKNLIVQPEEYDQVDLILYKLLRGENKKFNKRFSKTNNSTKTKYSDDIQNVLDYISGLNTEVINDIKKDNPKELDVSTKIELIFSKVMDIYFLKKLENSFNNSFLQFDDLQNKYSKPNLNINIDFDYFTSGVKANNNKPVLDSFHLISKIHMLTQTIFEQSEIYTDKINISARMIY